MTKTGPVKTKVKAGALGGAIAVVFAWILGLAGVDMPAEVAAGLSMIVSTGLAWAIPERVEQ